MPIDAMGRDLFGKVMRGQPWNGVYVPEATAMRAMQPLTEARLDALFVASRVDWSTVDSSYAARIRRGVNHVRAFYRLPDTGLRLSTLDITDCHECVLGQIWGVYMRSPESQLLGPGFCYAHGFCGRGDGSRSLLMEEERLTEEWRRALIDARAMSQQ